LSTANVWNGATSVIPPSTKEALVLTAERLFALHGLDGVSLRQICEAAGTRNNSAVQYHFGGKESLVQAILEYRIPAIAQRRRLLVAQVSPDDLRSVIEAHLLPTVELAESPDSYYATFLEQLQEYSLDEHPFTRLPETLQTHHHDYIRSVQRLLDEIPEPIRTTRIMQAAAISVHASAERERRRHHGTALPGFAVHMNNLFDGLEGFLRAPVSTATLTALNTARAGSRTRSSQA